MSDRKEPIRKSPAEILTNLMDGHREALLNGPEKARKYLMNFIGRANSIPNAVKFFLYDLVAEDAFLCGDNEACRSATKQEPRKQGHHESKNQPAVKIASLAALAILNFRTVLAGI